jgi:multidrug efflux pump subunit AcrB
MNGLIAWFANNHIAANLLLILLILSGALAIDQMPQKAMPDIDVNIITVGVPYLGASPEEVEQSVCIRIEESLDGIVDVKKISSAATEGMCLVSVELLEDADASTALDNVKNRVDAIDTFPEETEKPIIAQVTIIRSVMDIALTGPEDERTLKTLGQRVRDEIAALPNVTQVNLTNTRPYEISIEVSEQSLRRHGLTFNQVADTVRMRSLDMPGGSIKTTNGEILLRTQGQAYWGSEFEQLLIRTKSDGTRLYLKDVATIIDGFEDTDQMLRFDGKPAAIIRVSRVGEQDIQDITSTVNHYLDSAQSHLPKGVKLTVWNDNSKSLKDRLNTLINSARQGFLLVLILLAIFLRPRIAFWVSAGIPVAFMGALYICYLLGLSIDSISLFGFILVLGLLVDDAIVVGENVHSMQLQEKSLLTAAIKGTQDVSMPVIFGVLTTIAAFVPMMFAPGSMGQIQIIIATTVICCLLISLLESQLILPAHLGYKRINSNSSEIALLIIPVTAIVMLDFSWDMRSYIAMMIAAGSVLLALWVAGIAEPIADWLIARQLYFSRSLEYLIEVKFRTLSIKAMSMRYTIIAAAWSILIVTIAVVASGRLPFSFFPPVASDQVIAKLTMPPGTPASVTNKVIQHLEKSARSVRTQLNEQYPEAPPVTHILAAVGSHPTGNLGPGANGSAVGSTGGHLGEVTLQLTPGESRKIETREVADRWRELSGSIPDAIELKFDSSLFSMGNAIDIQLEGNDLNELRIVAEKLRTKLGEYPGVFDITDSFRSGKQELKLYILPSGEALGLSLETLARQIRQAFYGEEAQRIQRGRDDVKVMVRYTEAERQSLTALQSMRIRTDDGKEVPFATVAEAQLGQGFSSINRSDRRRVIHVIADVDRTRLSPNEVIHDLRAGAIDTIMRDHPQIAYSLDGEQREQGEALSTLLLFASIALFVIFALLAIPLKSYHQPLIIMTVIPFAYVGAIWGHMLIKSVGIVSGLVMMSVMGIVAASGVSVNSNLVLVDNINNRIKNGQTITDAVLDAVVSRCRPIVLTSLTTFIGLTPLMLNRSVQAQFLIPMAASLAFGVMLATLVTLLVVPSGYMVLEDIKALALRRRQTGLTKSA